jgi:hypothetical protein
MQQNCEELYIQCNKNLKFTSGVVELKVFSGGNLMMRLLVWDHWNCMLNERNCWGTRWHSWLRHHATSRKVAGSIPDGVTGIFH